MKFKNVNNLLRVGGGVEGPNLDTSKKDSNSESSEQDSRSPPKS